jgi:hypothetical protein
MHVLHCVSDWHEAHVVAHLTQLVVPFVNSLLWHDLTHRVPSEVRKNPAAQVRQVCGLLAELHDPQDMSQLAHDGEKKSEQTPCKTWFGKQSLATVHLAHRPSGSVYVVLSCK